MGYSKLYFKNDRLKAWLLLAIVAAIYLPFLNNPMVFDDQPFFRATIWNYTDSHFDFQFRWFPYTTLGITWVFFDDAPPVYRLQNMLLHAMNSLLLLLVLRLWISLFLPGVERQRLANWGAWLGALVFACHPLGVYGNAYIVQRSVVMATFFTLLMHLAYFRGLLDGDKRYISLAVAAYFLAVFSKEHSLTAPFVLLLLTWAIRNKIQLSLRALAVAWLGFALIALLVALRGKGVFGQIYEMDAPVLLGEDNLLNGMPMLHAFSMLTQAGLFFKYLLLMLIPNPAWMSLDMRETFIVSLRDWTGWAGLLGFAAYGVFAFLCLLRGGRIALFGLALLYPWCLFFTEFSTIRVQEIFVLYRAYLWLPGLLLLIPLAMDWISDRWGIGVGLLIILILIPSSINRLWVFADEYRLWNDAVVLLHDKKPRGAQRIYYGRGYAAEKNKKWDVAIEDYQQALQFNSDYPHIRFALAGVYMQTGRLKDAIAEYDTVLLEHPDYAKAHFNKAFALKILGDNSGATYHMEMSCTLGNSEACVISRMSKIARSEKSSKNP